MKEILQSHKTKDGEQPKLDFLVWSGVAQQKISIEGLNNWKKSMPKRVFATISVITYHVIYCAISLNFNYYFWNLYIIEASLFSVFWIYLLHDGEPAASFQTLWGTRGANMPT